MKKNRPYLLFCTLTTLSISLFTSCKNDDGGATPTPTTYAAAVRVQGSGTESTDYLVNVDDLNQEEISVDGIGIEQLGWRSYFQVGKTIMSVGYGDNTCIGYQANSAGILEEKGKFKFEKTLDCVGGVDESTIIAIEAPRSGLSDRIIHLIDVEGMSVTSKFPTPIYQPAGASLAAWPTGIIYRDSKVYVSFYQVDAGGAFSTPSVDTAMVAVYSYPDFNLEKVIKDTRTSPIGTYGNSLGLIKTDNGDIYSFSSSSQACGFTQQTKTSAIMRIKSGETEFDNEYFFDIEAKTGHKVNFFAPIGGNKAVVRLVTDDSILWGAYRINNPICKLALVDLVNETVTEVNDVPLHGGQYDTPVLVEGNKFYMNITTATEASLYEINSSNATAQKAATVLGFEAQGIFKLHY